MLVFVTSHKGGTGRSVTAANIAYRSALSGRSTCYLDYDFGSPTAGITFQIPQATNGIEGAGPNGGGLHRYLRGEIPSPEQLDVWGTSERVSLRQRPTGSGSLVLLPGQRSGSEFGFTDDIGRRCAELFLRLEEEFDLTLVDLSAGRSYASQIALAATANRTLRKVTVRWLVFHRWTPQHVMAAADLAFESGGILAMGKEYGHEPDRLRESLRFVRTAVIDARGPEVGHLDLAQQAFLRRCDAELAELARRRGTGRTTLLGAVPLDPLLQWREQLISDNDVQAKIANARTVDAFVGLTEKLFDETAWETV
ncbi:SCO2523 family variant P-loop protein [Micromonospora andamanensis]|uniref:DNA-binding protein n=1 Tax=Micromonospora andamanensis TaxID=1287068 RepID=A0ABQ4HZI9_9ACTN|nr:SCO2523 family variant P-loop protein [Micromonospora andamanensis]GIJ10926.1 DNA-binding protein [Micromonospora andamanensis]